MSVKKLLILAAAGIASVAATAAMAGGPDVVAAPAPDYSGVYIQGDLGYANLNYKDAYSDYFHYYDVDAKFSSNGTGGFTVGGALGYQFTRFLAAEVGAFYLPRVKGSAYSYNSLAGSESSSLGSFTINNWFLYMAGKLMAPVPWVDNLDIFFKAGVAYREARLSGCIEYNGYSVNKQTLNGWVPMFATGLMYWLNDNLYLKFQYMYVAHYRDCLGVTGHSGGYDVEIPAAHLFLGGIGYKFAM